MRWRSLVPVLCLPLLAGCNAVVLDAPGQVAGGQRDLLLIATALMLLIIVPVMAVTVLFAWRYRASNTAARYEPEWSHSTPLELVIWSAPLLIIICLGAVTWAGTHLLDPYRPLARPAGESRAASPAAPPLEVEVVALDWKWLFIYPQYGVATVNELAAPAGRPISFRITASTVMNSFFVPALAGQIYAMPGMETRLHAVVDRPGAFKGFSSNYSGAGFSRMRFAFHSLPAADFDAWIAKVRASGQPLDTNRYLTLAEPSEDDGVVRFGRVDGGLWRRILDLCVAPGRMCMSDMAAIDRQGGLGKASLAMAPGQAGPICRPGDETPMGAPAQVAKGEAAPSDARLTGAGLRAPGSTPVLLAARPPPGPARGPMRATEGF